MLQSVLLYPGLDDSYSINFAHLFRRDPSEVAYTLT